LFEGPAGANQPAIITDSPADAYSKMITVFIPLLVDEVVLYFIALFLLRLNNISILTTLFMNICD